MYSVQQRERLAGYIETGLAIINLGSRKGIEKHDVYICEVSLNDEVVGYEISVLGIALVGKVRNLEKAVIRYKESKSRWPETDPSRRFCYLLDRHVERGLIHLVDTAHGQWPERLQDAEADYGQGMSAARIAQALRSGTLG